jgi:DNA-binding protein H-NS
MTRNSLTDLLAQKAALDKKIAEMQQAHRSDAIHKVKAMMAEYGLTAADLGVDGAGPGNPFEGGGKRRGSGAKSASSSRPEASGDRNPKGSQRRKPSANAGKKVPPKYRDPATGDTWTGRGLKPKWLVAALDSGRSLSEFAL